MNALIMMLKNTATKKFHPIFYFESPLPGGMDANHTIIRYKSKGHHTSGFDTREAALLECDDVTKKCNDMGYVTHSELEPEKELEWDGTGIPADTQIR